MVAKGVKKNLNNSSARGTKSLIWIIILTGDYFFYEIERRNNSKTFIQYLESLIK